MSNNIINISLNGKSNPVVNITVKEPGSVFGEGTMNGEVKFVATGPIGPTGATGATGGAIIEDGSITSAKIAPNAIGHSQLAANSVYGSVILNNSVSNDKLVDNSITGSKIADNSITSNEIVDGSITRDLLSLDLVTGAQIEDGSIYANQIANNNVVRELIQNNAVGTDEIEDNVTLNGTVTVTNLDLSGSSPATITGPASDSLQIKSNTTIDFLNTSGNTIASLDQNGNLTISGTVDGVDIATDVAANSAKTGITTAQANAIIANTAKQTNVSTSLSYVSDSSKLRIVSSDGDNVDLPQATTTSWGVMTESDKTKLDGIESSADVTDTTNVEAAGALMDSELTDLAGVKSVTISTLQVKPSEGAFADGDKTKLDGIATGATASPDLTVDGAGTVHTNNITDLHGAGVNGAANQLLTDNGDGSISSESYLTWDSSTERLQISADASGKPELFLQSMGGADPGQLTLYKSLSASDGMDVGKIVFAATDTNGDYSVDYAQILGEIQESDYADGEGRLTLSVASHDGEIQPGLIIQSGDVEDEVDVTIANGASSVTHVSGNLTVGGTVDGIDIATDVAANTAKTSFPGFGTTAGTALEGNTTIPTQYTDADAVSAVATADNYLKNDASDTLDGSLTINQSIFLVDSGSGATGTKSKIVNRVTTSNRTLDVPDASGVLALTNSLIDTKTAAYWSNSTSGFYITLSGASTSENTSLSTASYTLMYVAPFDGKIKRISSFHQSATSGTSTFELYIDGDDSDLTNDQRGSDMTTSSFTRKFTEDCPADWTFSKGEAIAIKRTDSTARYGVTMTIVFEYDTTT